MICEALFSRPSAVLPGPGDDYWYTSYQGPSGGVTDATPETSTQVAAVFACVRVLAETLAQLPLHVMRDDGRTRSRAVDHSLYVVLHDQSNLMQTSFEWRETMQAHLALRGVAYSLIRANARGEIEQLVPLHPDRMTVVRLAKIDPQYPEMTRLGFLYRDTFGNQYRLTQEEVFYLRGLSFDGVTGVSPIAACRRAVELTMQSEYHGLMWWKNAAKPGGVLRVPQGEVLDDDAYGRMKQSWREAHTGADLYTVAILEGGTEFQAIGLSNEDSEWLETRRFQIAEICRMFRVPPHMVASAIEHGNTYANVEQSDLNFAKHTMLPQIVRWEQAIKRDLITDPQLYAKFALDGLLRADLKTRAEFYTSMFGIGVNSINDVLALEDRDPIEGGDRRFVSTQYVPLEMAGQTQRLTQQSPAGRDAEALAAWIADAAERLANAEIRLCEQETDRHPDQDAYTSVMTSYDGRHRQYATKAIMPIAMSCGMEAAVLAVVQEMADTLAERLLAATMDEVLAEMRMARQTQLTEIITRGLKHGA